MRRKLLYFLATIALLSCDPADTKLKVINNYKDSIYYQVGFIKENYYESLSILKKQWEERGTTIEYSKIGDTIRFSAIGNWNNKFSSPNDSLLIFATERQKLLDFFENKIERDSTCQVFVVTYKNLLDNNWTITISKSSNFF